MHDHARFATTRWSLVQAAGADETLSAEEQQQALAELCEGYWFPVYAHCRRRGASPEEAEDQTQGFFTQLLDGKLLQAADESRGRFRSYLLTALDHFLANEFRRARTQRRGGNYRRLSIDVSQAEGRLATPQATGLSPEDEFERRWALVMLENVYQRLQDEQSEAQRGELFARLRRFLPGRSDVPYDDVAAELKMSRVAIHRLRKRFGQLLRSEIAHTVASVDEVDDEIRRLQRALSQT